MNNILLLTLEVAGNVAKLRVLDRQTVKTPEIVEAKNFLNVLIDSDRSTISRLELEIAQEALNAHRMQVYADAMNH